MARALKTRNNTLIPDISFPIPPELLIPTPPPTSPAPTAPIGAQPLTSGMGAAPPASVTPPMGSLYDQAQEQARQAQQRIGETYGAMSDLWGDVPSPPAEKVFAEPFPTMRTPTPFTPYSYADEQDSIREALRFAALPGLIGGEFGTNITPRLIEAFAEGSMAGGERMDRATQLSYQQYINNLNALNEADIKGWEGRAELVRNQNIGIRAANQNEQQNRESQGKSLDARLRQETSTLDSAREAMRGEQRNVTQMYTRQFSSLIESISRDSSLVTVDDIKNRVAYINAQAKAIEEKYGLPSGSLLLDAEGSLAQRMGQSPKEWSLARQAEAAKERALINAESQANRLESELNTRQRIAVAELAIKSALSLYESDMDRVTQAQDSFKQYMTHQRWSTDLAYRSKIQAIQNRLASVRALYASIQLNKEQFNSFMIQARQEQDPKRQQDFVRKALAAASEAKRFIGEYQRGMAAWSQEAATVAVEVPELDPRSFSPPQGSLPSIPDVLLNPQKLFDRTNEIEVEGSTNSKKKSGQRTYLQSRPTGMEQPQPSSRAGAKVEPLPIIKPGTSAMSPIGRIDASSPGRSVRRNIEKLPNTQKQFIGPNGKPRKYIPAAGATATGGRR